MSATITIDKAGRVVLPKSLRDQMQLAAGDSLSIENCRGEIVLRPIRDSVQMRKKDGIWVFRTKEPISAESIHQTIREIREERAEAALHPEGTAGYKKESR